METTDLINKIQELYKKHNGENMGQVDYDLFAFELAELVLGFIENNDNREKVAECLYCEKPIYKGQHAYGFDNEPIACSSECFIGLAKAL